MEPRKQAICTALRRWIAQRPGLEFANYRDVKAYRSEMRSITKDRHHAETLLAAVEREDGITADALIEATRGAYSGRLEFDVNLLNCNPPRGRIDYCTGQYWPIEYRRAACAVLASALWAYKREHCMPPKLTGTESYSGFIGREKSPTAMSAGDWLRAHFRRELGRSIADRWFR